MPLSEIQGSVARSNWSCLVSNIKEHIILVAKLLANEYLQNKLFPRIAG